MRVGAELPSDTLTTWSVACSFSLPTTASLGEVGERKRESHTSTKARSPDQSSHRREFYGSLTEMALLVRPGGELGSYVALDERDDQGERVAYHRNRSSGI